MINPFSTWTVSCQSDTGVRYLVPTPPHQLLDPFELWGLQGGIKEIGDLQSISSPQREVRLASSTGFPTRKRICIRIFCFSPTFLHCCPLLTQSPRLASRWRHTTPEPSRSPAPGKNPPTPVGPRGRSRLYGNEGSQPAR